MRAAVGLGFPFAGDSPSQRKASDPEVFGIYCWLWALGGFLGKALLTIIFLSCGPHTKYICAEAVDAARERR